MKIKDLISILEKYKSDEDVYIISEKGFHVDIDIICKDECNVICIYPKD